MSVQAIGWVLDHSPTTGSERLVLISIANHAGKSPEDGAWESWPGIGLLQRESGLSRARTVQDALARLVEAGHLERLVNGAPDERIRRDRRPNLYRIVLANGVTCGDTRCGWCGVTPDDARGDAERPYGVTDDDLTGCRETSPEPSLNRVEPERQPTPPTPPLPPFDVFWQTYPRRTAKGEAEKAWAKAVRAAPVPVIIAGAARYRDDPNREPEFTCHPATWLNQRRWDDDPLPPRSNGNGSAGTRTLRSLSAVRARRDAPALPLPIPEQRSLTR